MNYTTDQYINKLNKDIQSLFQAKKQMAEGVYESIRLMDKRIFDQGKNADGSDIGSYSSKPLYVNPLNPNNPKKFATKGKFGQSKYKNGKPHKTAFFSSYGAYKTAIGRGNGNRVNLQLNKFFRRAFLTRNLPVKVEGEFIVIQFGVPSSKVNSAGKLKGLAIKYPGAFRAAPNEKKEVMDTFRQILANTLR